MSQIIKGEITCPECGNTQECSSYSSMNISISPELKNIFLSNQWNIFKCEKCGISVPVLSDMMYHDMTNEFIVWYIPSGNFDQKVHKLKKYNRILEKNNYFLRPIIVENRDDAIFMVHLCDKNGPPITKEREKDYFDVIQEIREMKDISKNIIDPRQYPTLATYQPKQIMDAVDNLQKRFPGMTEEQCLLNLEIDLSKEQQPREGWYGKTPSSVVTEIVPQKVGFRQIFFNWFN